MTRSLPLVLLFLPFFIACNRYQYATVDSSQLGRNRKNEFVFGNDSLIVVYNFMGQNLGATVSVVNNLSVPVYIDWRQSALIADGHTYSYAPVQVDQYGNATSDPNVVGSSAAMDRIPPHTTLNRPPAALAPDYLVKVNRDAWRRTRYLVGETSRSVKQAHFTEAASPLRFRTSITYLVGSLEAQPLRIEHPFYVSDVMSAMASPPKIMQSGGQGNLFYSSRLTTAGAVGAVFAVGAIIGGAVLITAIKQNAE